MEHVLYLNLSTKTASSTLGGSTYLFPKLKYGEQITLGVRLSQNVEGVPTEVERTISEIRASLGLIDARPRSGSYQIEIGDGTGDVTDPIAFNEEADGFVAAIAAIAAPTAGLTALGAYTAEVKDGSMLLRFANETVSAYPTPTPITASTTNSLKPLSFVRHRTFQEDGKWVHEIRLIQAPVASTDQSQLLLPPPPTIESIDDGGTSGGAEWNEIQSLVLPGSFRGTYRIRRGLLRTRLLSRDDGVEEIAEALEDLADEGGEFLVTNPADGVAHIEFAGDMGGIDQDLLTVEVFDAPAGDVTFTLDLDRPELHALLREQPEVELELEIEADIEDPDDDQVTYRRKLYSTKVKVQRELHWEELSVAANIDWLRPPLPAQYGGFDYSQISVGQAHHSDAYGNGADTAFVIDHNLDAADATVIVKDVSSGALLVLGTDYSVTVTNSNTLTVTSLVGAPSTDDWRITVLALDETSAFDPHTHPVSEITGLQTILDALGSRLSTLEGLAGGTALTVDDSESTRVAEWQLPSVFEIYPSRAEIEEGAINSIKPADLPRARGLLPAVHDGVVDNLSTIRTGDVLEDPSGHAGKVFVNDGTEFRAPGGLGHRGATISAGDHIASDGRAWYEVVRYDSKTRQQATFTTASPSSTITSTAHGFSVGDKVSFASSGTLPQFLDTTGDWWVVSTTANTFEVSDSLGGAASGMADDGTGTHAMFLVHEPTIEKFTAVADTAGSLDGLYLQLNDANGSVGVWFDVDNSGTTIPAGAAALDRAIEVTGIVTGGTATAVAAAVTNAIKADGEFFASSTGAVVTVTHANPGMTAASVGTSTFTSFSKLSDGLTAPESSFYPKAFERELFKIHVNEKQLRLRRQFELSVGMELAVLAANCDAQWSFVIEVGEYSQAALPFTPGANLNEIAWDPTPWLEQRIILTPTTTVHRFGARVVRSLINSVDTLTASRRVYGALEGGLTAPSSANFAVRGRLVRFDTDDNETEPEGMVALRGLDVKGGAADDTDEDESTVRDGFAIIQ